MRLSAWKGVLEECIICRRHERPGVLAVRFGLAQHLVGDGAVSPSKSRKRNRYTIGLPSSIRSSSAASRRSCCRWSKKAAMALGTTELDRPQDLVTAYSTPSPRARPRTRGARRRPRGIRQVRAWGRGCPASLGLAVEFAYRPPGAGWRRCGSRLRGLPPRRTSAPFRRALCALRELQRAVHLRDREVATIAPMKNTEITMPSGRCISLATNA